MPTITIPKGTDKNEKLIAIPKEQYGEFLEWQKKIKTVRTFKPTPSELRSLARARKDFREGKYITWDELKKELAHHRHKSNRKTA